MPSRGLNYHSGKRELVRRASPILHRRFFLHARVTHDRADMCAHLEFSVPRRLPKDAAARKAFARSNGASHGDDDIMRLTFIRGALFVTLVVALPCLTAGGADASSTIEPSILAASCANCHGTDGRSPGSIPSIAGIPYPVIKAKLEAFKFDPAPDATVMPRLMRAYDVEQIELLARYFSTINPGARP